MALFITEFKNINRELRESLWNWMGYWVGAYCIISQISCCTVTKTKPTLNTKQ